MRHPRPIVPRPHLAQLILANFFKRLLIRHRVILDRHLSRHPTHGVNPAAVARLNEQIHVRLQKMPLHSDFRARFGSTNIGKLRNFLMKLKM